MKLYWFLLSQDIFMGNSRVEAQFDERPKTEEIEEVINKELKLKKEKVDDVQEKAEQIALGSKETVGNSIWFLREHYDQ